MTELLALLDLPSPTGLQDLGGRWDRALMAGCRYFTLLDAPERATIRREIDRSRSWVLIGWAEGMASLAVREDSSDVLVLALIGLSLFNEEAVDARDAEVVLALLGRAAVLIGLDPKQVAAIAAEQTDPAGSTWLYAHAPDTNVATPPSHAETGAGTGFTFQSVADISNPEIELADFLDDR